MPIERAAVSRILVETGSGSASVGLSKRKENAVWCHFIAQHKRVCSSLRTEWTAGVIAVGGVITDQISWQRMLYYFIAQLRVEPAAGRGKSR